jgi:SDR family mycofactocin-dependent oxidoreductase
VGRLDDQVVLITGGARGQGRTHAARLAREGAHIVLVDALADMPTVTYPQASAADLADTADLVRRLGRQVLTFQADVRDLGALQRAVQHTVETFGRLDVVCANAGVLNMAPAWEITELQWATIIDVNLTGVWHTVRATVDLLREARRGSMILTASTAGMKGFLNGLPYVASKHGVVGIMRGLAKELAPFNVRVNCVAPTDCATDMMFNDDLYKAFRPDLDAPTREDTIEAHKGSHLLPVPWIEPEDVSAAVAWLASDDARFVTGSVIAVDAGGLTK